jgi:hypothetical protein
LTISPVNGNVVERPSERPFESGEFGGELSYVWPVAAEELRRLVKHLTFVDLNASQVLDALDTVTRMQVRQRGEHGP